MKKDKFVKLMNEFGDACITYTSSNSKKPKYIIGTLDFTTKYIEEKLNKLNNSNIKFLDDTMLVFSWDLDSFKTINIKNVTGIEPLSSLVPNDPIF